MVAERVNIDLSDLAGKDGKCCPIASFAGDDQGGVTAGSRCGSTRPAGGLAR
jgi:hypothetical protein